MKITLALTLDVDRGQLDSAASEEPNIVDGPAAALFESPATRHPELRADVPRTQEQTSELDGDDRRRTRIGFTGRTP